MKKAIVIGGGFTGCAWAMLLQKRGFEVTLFERDGQLGGGCRTLHYGGHPYTLGPRHLFTPHADSLAFLETYVPMRRLHHYLLSYVEQDGEFYSYPVHADDIPRMPDRKKIEQSSAILRASGLLAGRVDLLGASEANQKAETVGLYDFRTKRIYVRGTGPLDVYARVTLAHELTHVLQDQATMSSVSSVTLRPSPIRML